jgi:hypothetical protein
MRRRESRNARHSYLVVAAAPLLLIGCGSGTDDAATDTAGESTAPATRTPAAPAQQTTTSEFVLCPAFETVAADLAELLGFELDADRGVQSSPRECFVRGTQAEFVSLALAPAFIQSVTMQASGYEGSASAAPELGATALWIDAPLQPHVIFELDDRILDLGVELSMDAPDRTRVIEAAALTRDALIAANGG